ncbi:MAG: DUF2169 domain-containing protein [Polyangiaceae bacterium]
MLLIHNRSGLAFATTITSRRPPAPEAVLVVKATYAFSPSSPLELLPTSTAAVTGDVFADGDDDLAGELVYASDFAHFKPRAEWMVRASCHTPKGRPARECLVGVSVGGHDKRLRVVGPRVWVDDPLGSTATQAAPFTTMPITWGRAFGGSDNHVNPVGRGASATELPNIERVDRPIKKRDGDNAPAGFGALSPLWPARLAKMGRAYGPEWEARRAPFAAEDFDWTYHLSAPEDQWLDGYLKGDEVVRFEHLHPETSELTIKLPALRVRVFARRRGEAIHAVPMVLDTLFADLEKGQLSLVWRGLTPVRELDMSDLVSVLVAREASADAPQPDAHYHRELEALEADPIGYATAIAELEMKMGELDARLPPLPVVPDANPVGDELAKAIPADAPGAAMLAAQVRGAGQTASAAGPATMEKALASARAANEDVPPVPYAKPGNMPSLGLRKRIRSVVAQTASALPLRAVMSPKERARLDALVALPNDPKLKQADPEYSFPEPLSSDEPGPGANLVDHDLTGRDLSGRDLSGARLDGAVLTKANLKGANLKGASLRGAVLYKADLSDANLSQADLSRANLAKSVAPRACFDGATLDETFFQDAELERASFEEARGEWPVFERASAPNAVFRHAKLTRPDFSSANLEGATITHADIESAVFEGAIANGVDLSESKLNKSYAKNALFKNAKLVRARIERSAFFGATLDGADLSLARMAGTHLTEASLANAEVYGADLRGARLYRAKLSGSCFERANLFGADLTATRVDKTSFRDANLYDAKLLDAAGEGADFERANLERCIYKKRDAARGGSK